MSQNLFLTFRRNILRTRYLFRLSSDILREMPTGCRWRCPGNPLGTVFPWQESSRFRLASQIPPGKFSPTVCLNGCWSRKRGIVRRVRAGCASFSKNTIITIIISTEYRAIVYLVYSSVMHLGTDDRNIARSKWSTGYSAIGAVLLI